MGAFIFFGWDLSCARLSAKRSGISGELAELEQRAASIERLNKQLIQSNEELAQFAYVASHDLQEPLRSVVTCCQLLRNECGDRLDGDALAYIDYAVNGALRMKALVCGLLDFARIETQGNPLEPTSADDALNEALSNLELPIRESEATVERNRMPTVAADRTQLVQLVQNLIGNAVKYRSDAAPAVNVWAEEKESDWIFHVADNGLGVIQRITPASLSFSNDFMPAKPTPEPASVLRFASGSSNGSAAAFG